MQSLHIDAASSTPPFEQLRRQLIDQIMGRELAAGTKLPSVRAMAETLSLAPNTVARAYKELEAEGYLLTKGRGGTLVAPIAAADDATAQHATELARDYVANMRQLGFGVDAIVGEVRRELEAGKD